MGMTSVAVAMAGQLVAFGLTFVLLALYVLFGSGGYVLLVAGIYRLVRAEGSGKDWLPTLLDGLVEVELGMQDGSVTVAQAVMTIVGGRVVHDARS